MPSSLYKGHRFPVEIISHCLWLYHRFPLSLRDVEQRMAQRGVTVSSDTIHQWCRKFGQTYARGLRRRRPRPGDKWHLDELFIKINGKTHYLWRAVNQQGTVLDILVTSRWDAKAATRFFRKLLMGLKSVPRVLVTDKLGSYRVAHRRLMPGVEHRRSTYLNNRTENSTSRPGSGNGRGNDSAPPAAPSGSSQRSAGYHRTSGPAATDSPQPSTDTR
jgi:putative transposase